MNKKEKHILRHSLGLNQRKRSYRNHFVTGPGSKDFEDCEALVSKGLMNKRKYSLNEISEEYIYCVTDQGRKALLEAMR